MKKCSVNESCTGLDRLATWEEVRSAMASQGAAEPGCATDYDDVEPDSAGCVGVVPEKLAWLSLFSESLNPKCN